MAGGVAQANATMAAVEDLDAYLLTVRQRVVDLNLTAEGVLEVSARIGGEWVGWWGWWGGGQRVVDLNLTRMCA